MLNPEELARYSRHLRLSEIGTEEQEKLKNAKVLLIGMGGLGSPASLYLAAAGVGTLGLADFDKVELHNLQRQVIHTEAWLNKPKIDSASEQLLAMNGSLNLRHHPEGVTVENAVSLFSEYDVIVDGTDNFPTRYLNNDAAYFAGKPLVYGSVFQFEGQVSVFHPTGGGPCYRCLFPEMPEPGSVPNCDQAGVVGALCGIIGSFQAMEAMKLLMGIGESLMGKLLVIDTLGTRQRQIALKRDPACPLCGSNPKITDIRAENYAFTCEPEQTMEQNNEIPMEVSVDEAYAFRQNNPDTIFLDVREDFEIAICMISGARHIPMSQLGERFKEVPSDEPVLVYCHHGMRSLNVTEALRARGFSQVQSVLGGIDAWAAKFDSNMARY
ncbi:molybdopterin-synthase adenylyltransferase MoeB [Rubellicoccus peritrichatus]|uniref:Molybdopterin-synthase adenylyltransferase n=1 Tax=Rubellicoccus peritrichatus TaxID=3080537 RepID=A0AAQ3QRL9_9BACT|nr:molybdopterin-synthase adenylyltransferase MoeB [Puniceicoccus sp. CR14]WOO41453.1 molybdopterin-synthase adenylyltransferase MoeB [Puniceicoccus sp. CR14]